MKKNRLVYFAGTVCCLFFVISHLNASWNDGNLYDPFGESSDASRNGKCYNPNDNNDGGMPPLDLYPGSELGVTYLQDLGVPPADDSFGNSFNDESFFDPGLGNALDYNLNPQNTHPKQSQIQNVQKQPSNDDAETTGKNNPTTKCRKYYKRTKGTSIWDVDFDNPKIRENILYWLTCFFVQVMGETAINQTSTCGEGKNWANHIIRCLNDFNVLNNLERDEAASKLFIRIVGQNGGLQSNIDEAKKIAQTELSWPSYRKNM